MIFITPPSQTQTSRKRNESRLLEGDEPGGGGTETGTTVSDGLVGDGELSEVVSSHLGLDLDGGERLSVVNTTDGTDHLGDNDHVSQVGLDGGRLLVGGGLLLGLSELLDQSQRLSLETSLEPSPGSGVDEVNELLVLQVQELVKLDTSVSVLLEGTLPLELGGLGGVGESGISL